MPPKISIHTRRFRCLTAHLLIATLLVGWPVLPVSAQAVWKATADSSNRYLAKGNYTKAYEFGLRAALVDKPTQQADSLWRALMQITPKLPDSMAVVAALRAGKYYFGQNQVEQARSWINQAIAQGEKLGLPEYYLKGYVLLAKIEGRSSAMDKTLLLCKRVLTDAKRERCADCILESLLALTDCYLSKGHLDSANANAQKALTFLRQLPGFKTNRYYPLTQMQLSKCAYIAGDVTTAIREIEESYTVAKVIMPDDPYLIAICNMYTNVISDINDEKALEATQTARRVLMRQPNYSKHPYYLLLLGNEIGMLQTLDRIDRAVLLADSVFQRHPLDSISHLQSFDYFLDRVTVMYLTAQKATDLDRIAQKVTAMLTIDDFGGADPGYLYGILGRFCQYRHNFADAVRYYKEELRLDSLGKGATYLNHSLKNRLAICQAEAGQRADAYASFSHLVEDFDHNIHYNLWLMSEAERDNFLRTSIIGNLHRNLLHYPDPRAAEVGLAYDYTLLHQGVRLKTTRAINRLMNTQGQTDSSQNTIRQLVSIRSRLADRNAGIDPAEKRQLQQTADSLERVMGNGSVTLNKALKTVHWQEVRASLKPGEAAIEIIRYYNFSRNGPLDSSSFYAALLLRPEWSAPRVVHLPVPDDEQANSDNLGASSKNSDAYIKGLYAGENQKKLFEQFWQPIARALGPVKRVYVALDGSYLKLSLPTLRNPKTSRYLIDDLEIVVLNSTQDILEKPQVSQNRVAELVGHPAYYSQIRSNPLKPIAHNTRQQVRLRNGLTFDELPYTKVEVEQLSKLFKTFQLKPRVRMDTAASEAAFLTMHSPKILHVATHGFLRDTTRNAASQLQTCGLALTGAADTATRENKADGILTGYEASLLNLHGTELVVLSACESGVGNYFEGEGVHGLQRAFLLAGAQSVLMTLWNVNDQVAQQLMTEFYRNWLSGLSKPQALRKAQLTLRKQYPEPYYWGAFVLLGQ